MRPIGETCEFYRRAVRLDVIGYLYMETKDGLSERVTHGGSHLVKYKLVQVVHLGVPRQLS